MPAIEAKAGWLVVEYNLLLLLVRTISQFTFDGFLVCIHPNSMATFLPPTCTVYLLHVV